MPIGKMRFNIVFYFLIQSSHKMHFVNIFNVLKGLTIWQLPRVVLINPSNNDECNVNLKATLKIQIIRYEWYAFW